MSKRRNTFSRALKQLKSEEIDKKIQLTETLPTNNTMGVFISMPPGAVVSTTTVSRETWGEADLDFDADGESDGTDTTGLFETDGTPKAAMPPGDTSYILGPMSAMYYSWWSGGTTTIGYIRQADRKMVNLGTVSGKLHEWDGASFNSYGQLTLEQAQWFKDVKKKDDAGNNPDNANYRAFYPGPPSNTPDANGRYLCVITGAPKDVTTTQNVEVPHSPTEKGEMSADDNFGALMDRLKKGLFDFANPLSKIKDLFGEYLTPPAAEYSANIAKSILQNKPINVNQSDIPKGDIDKLLNNLEKNIHGTPLTDGTTETPYADDNMYIDNNGNVKSNIGPNGETGYYKNNQTGDMGGGKGIAGYGNPLAAAGQAQIQVVYPEDGSEPYFKYTDHAYHNLKSTDPGEVPDKIKETLSALVHAVSGKSDADAPNTGAMSGYPPNIKGDVKTEFKIPLSQVPQGIQDKAKFELEWQKGVKSGKYKDFQFNHHSLKGRVLSEDKASRVLKNLKKPIVLPEGKKKTYKVKPGARMRGMDTLIGDIKPQESYKEPQKIWSKNSQGYNARSSQEKKNQVLQYVGASMDHWDYMTDTVKKQGGKIMANYKDHDYLYDYWLGGTRKKAVRKEEVKGDYVVFLDDGTSMLQSSYNEKVEKEKEKEMFDEYYKLNPKNEPIPYENDPLFKKVSKRLKPVIDYPEKPAKKGYPNEPPPKMVNGWHPEYGQRYKYDKLDPVSAKAMPPTGNPEIDANVEKTKAKPK